MPPYNTGNPLPSTNVFDLYDNAHNLDLAMNDRVNAGWVDRLGVTRRTWSGIEAEFEAFLLNSGYVTLGDYAAGITFTTRNQYVVHEGEFYRVAAGTPLPYTTTGIWVNDAPNLVAVGDAVLRQQLAASGGAGLVGFAQEGGGVLRSLEGRGREVVLLSDFGGGPGQGAATNDAAFAAAMAVLGLRGGGTLHVSQAGIHDISATISSSVAGINLHLAHATTIRYPASVDTAVSLLGANCSVTGGFGGGFLGPELWDGANVSPTYGVLRFGGRGARCSTRLINIKKVGVWLKDLSDAIVTGCEIVGNYPAAQWTGVETAHYGISCDPDVSPSGGNFLIHGNRIKSCVQGVFVGNYGSGDPYARGVNISVNNFEGCWNHGIYSNYTDGMVVSANTFNRCQLPVVASGHHNLIIGNTMFTSSLSGTDERDIVGISVRDPSYCIIKGNTLRGTTVPAAAVVVNLQYFGLVPGMMIGNVVEGNTIEIFGTNPCNPIRIIGESFSGATTVVDNSVIGNNIIAPCGEDGAILIAGYVTGSSHGNKVANNTIAMLAGNNAIRFTTLTRSTASNNTVDWRYDSPTPGTSVMSVAFVNTSFCRATENATVISFNFGANLTPYGVREFGTCNMNSSRDSIDMVDLTKSGAYAPVFSISGSLMDIQESGPGAPIIAARIGSTWRRFPFGGPGNTFYVKESGTDGSGWTAK